MASDQRLALVTGHWTFGRVYPREPGAKARRPVRQKLRCEAPAGVADPVTTWAQRGGCFYPGGRVVPVSRNSGTQGARQTPTDRPGFPRPPVRLVILPGFWASNPR